MSDARKPPPPPAVELATPPFAGVALDPAPRLQGKRVTLCVTGSIAAYKAVVLLRLLRKEGAEVEVVLSRSATQFVGAATFAGLNGRPPFLDMFSPAGGELHVELGGCSDLLLIVPATADVIARLAAGRADDLIAALALASRCPVLIAPAMHPNMWDHPATQRNVGALLADGRVSFVGPTVGEVASGDVGQGRMAEPEVMLARTVAALRAATLGGRHLVVTAGPTAEDLDPVRYFGNRSSGKMGFAIAERAAARGGRVTLIAGPVALPTPPGVVRVDVRSALSMRAALWEALGAELSAADALIMAAAVADYRPAETHATKLKRSAASLQLDLTPNPDLLAEIGHARTSSLPILVGFALETDDDEGLLRYARAKLVSKRVDLVVANRAEESLGRDAVRALLVTGENCSELRAMPKTEAADRILDWVSDRLQNGAT